MIVHNPYDGQPVKVRKQDLERAIRDREGRIFYAVLRSDGQGYYGAVTRKGSEKEEQRHIEMLEKTERAREMGALRSAQQIHDATGKRSGVGILRRLVWIIILGAIAAAAWFFFGPDKSGLIDGPVGRLQPPASGDVEQNARGYVGTASGLRYTILKPGDGATALAGKYVKVRYSVWTLGGEKIESSDAEHPVGFVLWSGHTIRGWDEGITGRPDG